VVLAAAPASLTAAASGPGIAAVLGAVRVSPIAAVLEQAIGAVLEAVVQAIVVESQTAIELAIAVWVIVQQTVGHLADSIAEAHRAV
jgi:hypothetical protein